MISGSLGCNISLLIVASGLPFQKTVGGNSSFECDSRIILEWSLILAARRIHLPRSLQQELDSDSRRTHSRFPVAMGQQANRLFKRAARTW